MQKFPRILIISNNAFSQTQNNGKTLASFFLEYPVENIAQLYFKEEVPNSDIYKNYFKITDIDIINKIIGKVEKKVNSNDDINKSKETKKYFKTEFFRIIREFLWKNNRWESEDLYEWLEKFKPEIIFLCGGDFGAAYDVSLKIKDKFKTKLILYLTDDYILPRRTLSLFWWLRRNYIFKKIKTTINESFLFITISEKMRKMYKEIYGKESIVIMNMSESLKNEKAEEKKIKILTYAGGLHYKRDETLKLLGEAIKEYNNENDNKYVLKIYSMDKINKKILVKGASEFLGGVTQDELKKILNDSDINVHVESFSKKSIESTRLSISTKISEYLSVEKPILAIGPSKIASMEYLEDTAFCINNPKNIKKEINKIFKNKEFIFNYSLKSAVLYKKNHDIKKERDKLFKAIMSEKDRLFEEIMGGN